MNLKIDESGLQKDAKDRTWWVGRGWLVIDVGSHQAARLAAVSWWRLTPDTLQEGVFCLDLAAGERLLKLYFEGEAAGLEFVQRWLEVPPRP